MDYGIFRGRVTVVCVGNELNGDDAAGEMASRLIGEPDGMQVIFAHTAPENFLDEIVEYKPDRVILVDAADFGGTPGQMRLLDVKSLQSMHFSTHRAPLKLFLGRLKEAGIAASIVGIQAGNTGLGEPMSPEVKETVRSLAKGAKAARKQGI